MLMRRFGAFRLGVARWLAASCSRVASRRASENMVNRRYLVVGESGSKVQFGRHRRLASGIAIGLRGVLCWEIILDFDVMSEFQMGAGRVEKPLVPPEFSPMTNGAG